MLLDDNVKHRELSFIFTCNSHRRGLVTTFRLFCCDNARSITLFNMPFHLYFVIKSLAVTVKTAVNYSNEASR